MGWGRSPSKSSVIVDASFISADYPYSASKRTERQPKQGRENNRGQLALWFMALSLFCGGLMGLNPPGGSLVTAIGFMVSHTKAKEQGGPEDMATQPHCTTWKAWLQETNLFSVN